MYNPFQIQVDLDQVLRNLFYVYAFSLPFELVLEILFGIDTIFKPFRVLSLAIIGVFTIRLLKNKLYINSEDRTDLLLYAVFIYGILISFVRIIGGVFNFGLFYNDLFQLSLHIATFFIFKTVPFSSKQILILFKSLVLGLIINGGYIFSEFVFLNHYGRQPGFTNNPNFVSLGLVAGITFLILRLNYIKEGWRRILYGLSIFFMMYIFIIQGSRTGLLVLLVSSFILFFYYSIRTKILLTFIGGLMVFLLLLLPMRLEEVRVGGGPLVLVTRVIKKSSETTQEDVRFVLWRGVFRVLEDQGYAGVGIGQYKAMFPRYYSEEAHKTVLEMVNRGYFLSTHNDYLAILTDYGLPSLLFYLLYICFTLKKIGLRMLYPKDDEEAEMLYRFAFIMFACLIIFGLTTENFQHPLFWFLLAFSTKKI